MMDKSDIGMLLLDYFGKDCSFEVGYMYAIGMPVYGVFVDYGDGAESIIDELCKYKFSISKVFKSVDHMVDFLKQFNMY